MKKLIFVGLNEFNRDLLEEACQLYDLPNLKKVLSLNEYETFTPDHYDSGFLEPWSQWVTVHTGLRAQEHGIKHLGDVPKLGHPQIWEVLSKQNVTSGVWGAMNANKGDSQHCRFFLPDPWTFSENAYPKNLDSLLNFPRFMAKNRLHVFQWEGLKSFIQFCEVFLTKPSLWLPLIRYAPQMLFVFLKHRAPFAPFAFTELMSTLAFLEYRKKFKPQFSMIFLNTIAHIQHYYWKKDSVNSNERFRFGFYMMDQAFAKLFASLDQDEKIIVSNAFSQANTNHEEPFIGYRPVDHGKFLTAMGIEFKTIEALMTMDAHLFCDTIKQRDHAFEVLNTATVEGNKLFFVEKDKINHLKLFYRTDYTGKVSPSAKFSINGNTHIFFEWFSILGERTGKHQQVGSVFSDIKFPDKKFENKNIFNLICSYFIGEKTSLTQNKAS